MLWHRISQVVKSCSRFKVIYLEFTVLLSFKGKRGLNTVLGIFDMYYSRTSLLCSKMLYVEYVIFHILKMNPLQIVCVCTLTFSRYSRQYHYEMAFLLLSLHDLVEQLSVPVEQWGEKRVCAVISDNLHPFMLSVDIILPTILLYFFIILRRPALHIRRVSANTLVWHVQAFRLQSKHEYISFLGPIWVYVWLIQPGKQS